MKRYYVAYVRFDKCYGVGVCYAHYSVCAKSTNEAKKKIEKMASGTVMLGTLKQLPDGVFRFSN